MKTLLCLVSATVGCLVTLSLTVAVPISEPSSVNTSSSTTLPPTTTNPATDNLLAPAPTLGYLNGSKLVVTNVVKTLQFDVALEDDDGENSTETGVPRTPFIETDLQILDPALLGQVVSQIYSTVPPSIDGTKNQSTEEAN